MKIRFLADADFNADSKKTAIHSVAEDLLLIWAASEAEEWKNVICTVPL